MSDIIASGKAHYRGTSKWSAAEIVEENMKAVDLISKLDDGARKEIEELFVSD